MKRDKSDIGELIDRCSQADFDGHTEFCRLTAREKILWLSSTVYFLFKVSRNNPGMGCSSFFKGCEEND